MTRFYNIQNSYLSEIWEDENEFMDELGNSAPPYFINEYLIDPAIKSVVTWAYKSIANYFKNNMILANEENFKVNFVMKFYSVFPAYYADFNGDISKIQNVANYGDFTFLGEQVTETNEDTPFNTPTSAGKYSFKQKSDKELIEAFEYRKTRTNQFMGEFSSMFQRALT